MLFHFVVHGQVPKDEILGVVVGHIWYFFSDVWPGLHDGQRPLAPPSWWVRVWEGRQDDDRIAVDGVLMNREDALAIQEARRQQEGQVLGEAR